MWCICIYILSEHGKEKGRIGQVLSNLICVLMQNLGIITSTVLFIQHASAAGRASQLRYQTLLQKEDNVVAFWFCWEEDGEQKMSYFDLLPLSLLRASGGEEDSVVRDVIISWMSS